MGPGSPSAGSGATGEVLLECPLCLLAQPASGCPALPSCGHRACRGCLERYLRLAIGVSRLPAACPHCPTPIPHPAADLLALLPPEAVPLRRKYEESLLRRLLVADPGTRWCPAPGCSSTVIAYSCAEYPCLVCGTQFCYHCRQLWHPGSSCKQAWLEWKQEGGGSRHGGDPRPTDPGGGGGAHLGPRHHQGLPPLWRLHHEDKGQQLQLHELHRLRMPLLLALHAGGYRHPLVGGGTAAGEEHGCPQPRPRGGEQPRSSPSSQVVVVWRGGWGPWCPLLSLVPSRLALLLPLPSPPRTPPHSQEPGR